MDMGFEASWQRWKALYVDKRQGYNQAIWADVGFHPLDKALDELARLYLRASPAQIRTIERALHGQQIEPWDLVLYIRRAGVRLLQERKTELLEWALAIAVLCSRHVDPRDLIVSIILLFMGADRISINPEEFIEKMGVVIDQEMKKLFLETLHMPAEDINLTVKMFGPADWK